MLAPIDVFAQADTGAPPTTTRLRFGPLYVNPVVALTNAGIDNNVFNEPDSEGPKRDFTMTVTPAADMWLRLGPSWLRGNIKEDLLYFQTYSSQNSANTSFSVNWVMPFNRLTINPGLAYLNTNDRPGFEIDTRAPRVEVDYNGMLEYRLGSKTFVGARIDQRTTDFAPGQEFNGTNLNQELNRTVTTAGFTVRYQATPLTSVNFETTREEDRFEFSPLRDTDSTLFTGGLKFDPAALLKGSATFGYRDFRPLSSDVPGYQGSIAAVNLSYVPAQHDLAVRDVRARRAVFVRCQPAVLLADWRERLDQPTGLRASGCRRPGRGTAVRVSCSYRRAGGSEPRRSRHDVWGRRRLSHGERFADRLQRRSISSQIGNRVQPVHRLALRIFGDVWVMNARGHALR